MGSEMCIRDSAKEHRRKKRVTFAGEERIMMVTGGEVEEATSAENGDILRSSARAAAYPTVGERATNSPRRTTVSPAVSVETLRAAMEASEYKLKKMT